MRKIILGAVAVAATTTAPAAYALNFNFSFTGTNGGVVTGEIFGVATGHKRPSDIKISSEPLGFWPAAPFDVFAFGTSGKQAGSGFDVANGKITYANELVQRTKYLRSTTSNVVALRFNDGGNGFIAGGLNTGNGLGFPGIAYVNTTVHVQQAATSAPEPASIALIGAGLVGISAFRRRRAAV